jgi:hypothetical protein
MEVVHTAVNIFNTQEREAAYERHGALWRAVKQTLLEQHVCGELESEYVTLELFCALCCLSQLKDATLAQLPPLVEQAWQRALLNTRLYRLFCEDVFGQTLEYSTVNRSRASQDITEALYCIIFGHKPPRDIWSTKTTAITASSFLDDLDEPAFVQRPLKVRDAEEEENKTRKRRRLSAVSKRLDDLLLDRPPQHSRVDQPEQPLLAPGLFQITVRTVDSRTRQFTVWDTMTVLVFKKLIHEKEDVPVEEQRLVLTGKVLDDNTQTLASYGVKPGATLHLVPRAKGC